jgi:tetratricopeptide (TPR) repeat protein
VEIHRVFGNSGQARLLLDGIADERLPVLCRLHRAYDRLGWQPARLAQATAAVARLLDKQPQDELVLLLLLEQVERLYQYGEQDGLHHLVSLFDLAGASSRALVQQLADMLLDRFGSAWQPRISRLLEVEIDSAKALDYLHQSLAAVEEAGDSIGVRNLLTRIGNFYHALGDYERALHFHQQALVTNRMLGDRYAEANNLSNLGLAYANLDRTEEAINHFQEALAISQEIDDRSLEGNLRNSLGLVYANQGQIDEAIHHGREALVISRETGDRHAEARNLVVLGLAYQRGDEDEQALDYLQQALPLLQEIGDSNGEAFVRATIEKLHAPLGPEDRAPAYWPQTKSLDLENDDQRAERTVENDEATVRLDQSGRIIVIDNQELHEPIDPGDAGRLAAWAATGSTPPWQFAREFTSNWQAMGDILGGLLLGQRLRAGERPRRLRAELPANLGYLPWELAQLAGRPFVMSERFPSFYRGYNLSQPLEQPQAGADVLLLRLGAALERIEQRGYSETGGDLHQLFAGYGLSVETVEQPDPAQLGNILRTLRPSVLYLEANVIESRLGPVLYFGDSRLYKGVSSDFSARKLTSALGDMRGAPLIILDAPAAPDPSENMRQLCLRNAFAVELIDHNHVSAVIATGLADPYRVRRAPVELIAEALAEKRPARDVVSQLWQTAAAQTDWNEDERGLLDHLLPFAGTALFAREPMRILELGT